jgi:single-strand DNA-binding protein
VLQRFRGELVLLGGRDEGASVPDEGGGDWGRTASEPARGGGGGGGRRPGKSEDYDDLDDEIPF